MIEKRGDKWCVLHGHPQKEGSKTDKPIGSVIKCFPTEKQAIAMHQAIIISQQRGDSKYFFVDISADGKQFLHAVDIADYDQEGKARELGAAFKKGFPETYTKSQTGPVFRESEEAKKKELERLVAVLVSKGHEKSAAYAIAMAQLKKKYEGHGGFP